MNINDLLKDIDDSTEWAINETTKLRAGELKQTLAQAAQAQQQLQMFQRQMEELRQQYANQGSELENLRNNAATQIEAKLKELLAGQTAASAVQNNANWDPFADPGVFKPFVDRFNTYGQQASELDKQIKVLGQTVGMFMRRALERELRNDFDAIQDRPDDIDYDKVYRFASERRYTDQYGIPDVRRGYEELARPHLEKRRQEQLEKEAERKVRADFQKQQRAGSVVFPGVSGKGAQRGAQKDEKVGGRNAIRQRFARDGGDILNDLASGRLNAEVAAFANGSTTEQ